MKRSRSDEDSDLPPAKYSRPCCSNEGAFIDVLATHVAATLAQDGASLSRRALGLVNRELARRISDKLKPSRAPDMADIRLVPVFKYPTRYVSTSMFAEAFVRSLWPEKVYDDFVYTPRVLEVLFVRLVLETRTKILLSPAACRLVAHWPYNGHPTIDRLLNAVAFQIWDSYDTPPFWICENFVNLVLLLQFDHYPFPLEWAPTRFHKRVDVLWSSGVRQHECDARARVKK